MKIVGIKKAVGEYQRANAGGCYSPSYGNLMLDRSTGEVWCDYFYSPGHNSWKEYHDPAVIDLSREIQQDRKEICMRTVKEYAARICSSYTAKL